MLTVEQFKKLYPGNKDPEGWVNAMNEVFPQYGITNAKRIAAFIAQCGHESIGWTAFSENLNYSAKSLNAVFPKYFKNAGRNADEYARQPEKIANIVYANRMDNGDSASGDGWRYRGRGPIQLTGKVNYKSFGKAMGVDVVSNPDLVSTDKKIALMSAIWFWNSRNLNDLADNGDIKTMTKKINGGYIGLEDRIKHYNEAIKCLGEDAVVEYEEVEVEEIEEITIEGILRRGSRGEGVQLIQEALGLDADGIFGKGTEAAVKEWQESNGLVADGIVGPLTLEKLLGD